MSNEIATKNPFANSVSSWQPAMSEVAQTKATSEIQAAVFMAKQFPRDQIAATERILNACQRESLAKNATYLYSKGGTEINSPAIRLAEAIAASWGNIDCGIVEVERNENDSTVMSYAWDLETNYRCTKTFTVPHAIDLKGGKKKILRDGREIYENIANHGSRRLRACILAVIPGDIVDAAVEQCQNTLLTNADTSPENIKRLLKSFAEYGVNKEMIEIRIQRKIESIQPAQLVKLRTIYSSIKDGMSVASDWFDTGNSTPAPSTASQQLAAALEKKPEIPETEPEQSPPAKETESADFDDPPVAETAYWFERIQRAKSDADLDDVQKLYMPFIESGELDGNAETRLSEARRNRRQELKAF